MISVNRCSSSIRSASLHRGRRNSPCSVSMHWEWICRSNVCNSSWLRWLEMPAIHRWHSRSKMSEGVSPSIRFLNSGVFQFSSPMISRKSLSESENSDLSAPNTSTSCTSMYFCRNFITLHLTLGVSAALMMVSLFNIAVKPYSSSR